MRKILFVLIALMLATAFVAAQEAINVPETDTATGDSIIEPTAVPTPAVVRKPIARLHLVGSGIAVSESDAFDFMHARAVIGAVKVKAAVDDNCVGGDGNCIGGGFVVKRVGVLTLDDKKYHLKDIAVAEDEISAEVYGPITDTNAGSAVVGEIKVKRFEKPGKDVWAGNMVLNGKAFNVYFIGVKRDFKKAEITEKIGEQCKNNPDDARCKNIVAECARNTEQCGERVKAYCEANPTSARCLQLKKLYCLKNATDERCREYLKGLCEKYPKLAHCAVKQVAGKNVTVINESAVSAITAERGEVDENLLAVKNRDRIKNIVKNVVGARRAGAT
jgi:hypothetical protein